MSDGIFLTSVQHPLPSFWRRVWFWLFPPALHASALVVMEIDLPEDE